MFLPTTLESTDKIVETIEELKVKIPSNPLEADILAMAEMIAEAEELDKASSDLCGRPRVVMRELERTSLVWETIGIITPPLKSCEDIRTEAAMMDPVSVSQIL